CAPGPRAAGGVRGRARSVGADPRPARRTGAAGGRARRAARPRRAAHLVALASVHSRAQTGLEAPPVTVEVDLSGGLPMLAIVGLPEAAVKESKDRVRAAINNSGFSFPQ